MITMPKAKDAAKKMPMTESSRTVRRCEKQAMSTATAQPATAPPSRTEPCRTKAMARPGKTAWDTASPMKAMPRRTTKQPTTPQTTAARTEMASARARKSRCGLARSWKNSTRETSIMRPPQSRIAAARKVSHRKRRSTVRGRGAAFRRGRLPRRGG